MRDTEQSGGCGTAHLYVDHRKHGWVVSTRHGDMVTVRPVCGGKYTAVTEADATAQATEMLARDGLAVEWTHVPNPTWPGFTGCVTRKEAALR